MPFALWFYLSKVGFFTLFAICFATFFAQGEGWLGRVGYIAVCGLIVLGLVSAFMAILLIFGKLRMLCPFCGKSGQVVGSKREGMCMVCDTCGYIRGSGPLRLKIIREEITYDDEDSEDDEQNA